MPQMVTLRLSEASYRAVKAYAAAENTSMNAWIEGLLDAEDMRRRCLAHEEWIKANPEVSSAAVAFWEANQRVLADGDLPNLRG